MTDSAMSREQLVTQIQEAQGAKNWARADQLLRQYSIRANSENWGNSLRYTVTRGQLTTEHGSQNFATVSLEGPKEQVARILDAAKSLSGYAAIEGSDERVRFQVDDPDTQIEDWLTTQSTAVNHGQPETEAQIVTSVCVVRVPRSPTPAR